MKAKMSLLTRIDKITHKLNSNTYSEEDKSVNHWISMQLKRFVKNNPQTTMRDLTILLSTMYNNLEKNQGVYGNALCGKIGGFARRFTMENN
jgi:hypothetical protein